MWCEFFLDLPDLNPSAQLSNLGLDPEVARPMARNFFPGFIYSNFRRVLAISACIRIGRDPRCDFIPRFFRLKLLTQLSNLGSDENAARPTERLRSNF